MKEEDNTFLTEKTKLEEARSTLEAITGWIISCDSKAGILLAFFGTILTIILTNEGLEKLCQLFESAGTGHSAGVSFIVIMAVSIAGFVWGIFNLVLVLLATTDSSIFKEENLETDSIIFFGTISKNDSYSSYKNKYLKMDREGYLNDLLSQIFITSLISQKKYKYFNTGIKFSAIGFSCFVILFLIGNYVFL